MTGSVTAIFPMIIVGLVLLVLAVWLFMRLNQSTTIVGDENEPKDVLDDGAAPAQRNQALIDSAPAAVKLDVNPEVAIPAKDPVMTQQPVETAEPTPAPEAKAAPAPTPAPTPEAAPKSDDDLSKIKGVGPKLVALLKEEGVTNLAQIAAWSEADIEAIDARLGRFKGRITRDQWVEQAKLLTSGDDSAYAAKFGNNG